MPICGICQENSGSLTPEEKRQIARQLHELETLRAQVVEYQRAISEYQSIHAGFSSVCTQAVDAERRAGEAIAGSLQREVEAERANAKFYREAYEMLLKRKPGIGCWVKRIFTLGMARC